MRGSSLATRLFLSATLWLVVILAITGVVLSSVYRSATERAFDRRLNLYLRTLIAEVATPDEPPDRQFQSLGEPLFELPLSGWYWQITRTDSEKADMRASRSLWDKKLPKLEDHGIDLTAAGISAPTASISSPSPATPPRFSTKPAVLIITSAAPLRRWVSCCY
jgi:hypothetical protein